MEPRKPTKISTAKEAGEETTKEEAASAGAEDDSKQETSKADPIARLRTDQQALAAALLGQPDGIRAFDRCLRHLDMLDRLVVPALRKAGAPAADLRRCLVWHDLARILLADLRSGSQDGEDATAKQAVLAHLMTSLMKEEQAPDSGIFALIATSQPDLGVIAPRLQARNAASQEQAETQPDMPELNTLRLDVFIRRQNIPSEDYPMARQQNDRPRDEEGRFTSRSSGRYDRDDDHRSEGSGWYGDSRGHAEAARRGWEQRDDRYQGSRGGRDDDDRSYGRGGSDRPRDDEGRFMSDDRQGSRGGRYEEDDRRYSSRGRGRDDDDDRGHGGWFGDPRGHSEASRLGWDHREGGSRSRDDDDRRYGRGGSGGNDRARDDQGRFMSDDDRQGSRGGRYEEDDRRYSSRGHSRDDDDDRGHGGWFGDPRGHSEASRRGWENRRR